MSEEWLFLIVMGLLLDILGVIILTGPLLQFDLKDFKGLKRRYEKTEIEYGYAVEKHEHVKKYGTPNAKTTLTKEYLLRELARLDEFVHFGFLRNEEEKLNHFENAIIALVVIITGFVLQVIGNILQQ